MALGVLPESSVAGIIAARTLRCSSVASMGQSSEASNVNIPGLWTGFVIALGVQLGVHINEGTGEV